MKSVTIFLPGDFEDACIYMGRLLVVTAERAFYFYNYEQIIQYLENQSTKSRSLLTYLFSRNDWLASNQFRVLAMNEGVRETILHDIDELSRTPIELSSSQKFIQTVHKLDISASVFLDITVYNQRVYIGADSGLYHIDFEWTPYSVEMPSKPEKRHDAKSINTSAKYGSINVSCGDEGLFCAFDEFRWVNSSQSTIKKFAEKSLRIGWFDTDLINYSTSTSPSFLRGKHESIQYGGADRERKILVEVGTEIFELDYLFENLLENGNIEDYTIQYVYNSNTTMFVHTLEGYFYVVGIQKSDGEHPKVRFTKTFKGENTRILSVHPCKTGLIIETNNKVFLFANGDWYHILDSEVLSVRTHSKSKRYQNIVVDTTEEGIYITSMFDEIEWIGSEFKLKQ